VERQLSHYCSSALHTVFPVGVVKRYLKMEMKQTRIPHPLLIGEYNKFMGGADLMDENINRYRIGICGKKWWWPLFKWLLEVSIQKAWQPKQSAGFTLM
jgi:hypothetical protein